MLAGKALEGVFYVLRTGCQWKALPREYGSGSTVHRTFPKWLAAGFFEKIRAKGLEKVVAVTHSFFNRFRKLLVRFEKKAANYWALVQLACAGIVWP